MNLYNKILHYSISFVLLVSMAMIMAYNVFDVVELNSSNITQAPFNCLTGAFSCDLSNLGITSIAPDAFIGHSSLAYLDLNNNQLTTLESGDFNGLSGLLGLNIINNQISFIESGAFLPLTSLKTLNLTNNRLSSVLPGMFQSISHITSLFLSNNLIRTIYPSSFGGLSELTTLHFTSNLLTRLSPGMFDGLSGLTSIYLGNNFITGIDSGTFQGLSNLKTLYMASNLITSLESGDFIGLPPLDGLYLSNNQIASLEADDFIYLTGLKSLYISSNQIRSLSSGVFLYLPEVTTLFLTKNQLTHLGSFDFAGLNSLSDLRLDNNAISDIESGTFAVSVLPRLSTLSLLNLCVPNQLTGSYGLSGNVWSSNAGYCGVISSSVLSEITSVLTGQGYILSGEGYVGEKPLYMHSVASGSLPLAISMLSTGYLQSYYSGRAQVEYSPGILLSVGQASFSGVLFGPVFFHPSTINLSGVVGAVRFGDVSRKINFSSGLVTVKIPVSGVVSGENVWIYTSSPGIFSWTFHTGTTVYVLSGVPYVSFTTSYGGDFVASTLEYIAPVVSNSVSSTQTSGGGGSMISIDVCPNGDFSESYYDGDCGVQGTHEAADQESSSEINDQYHQAYLWAKSNNLTSKSSYESARMFASITRAEAAKIISIYAISLQKKVPDETLLSCGKFSDISSLNSELQSYVKISCQLGLMGLESDGVTVKGKFNPSGLLNRAEFGTLLSRLLRGTTYSNDGGIYYKKHLQALKDNEIMTKISTPSMKELRGNVFLMMSRIK